MCEGVEGSSLRWGGYLHRMATRHLASFLFSLLPTVRFIGIYSAPSPCNEPAALPAFFRENSFDFRRLAHFCFAAYSSGVYYITRGKELDLTQEADTPTEAQSRFSRREAHS